MVHHKYLFLFLILSSCALQKRTVEEPQHAIFNDSTTISKIDTIESDFYYEAFAEAYMQNDVITKPNGFIIESSSITEASYLNGIYRFDINEVYNLSKKTAKISYDEASLGKFYYRFIRPVIGENTNYMINPFCYTFYKKIHMKVAVAYVSYLNQKVPLFLNCEEYDKHVKQSKRGYGTMKLPTYLIINVFNWAEL